MANVSDAWIGVRAGYLLCIIGRRVVDENDFKVNPSSLGENAFQAVR
jgi:hypothetical protein